MQMDYNLKGKHAKDEVGNRYKITAHYGGVGLPIPEMICMTLLTTGVIPKEGRMDTQKYVSIPRDEFDKDFTVVNPVEKV